MSPCQTDTRRQPRRETSTAACRVIGLGAIPDEQHPLSGLEGVIPGALDYGVVEPKHLAVVSHNVTGALVVAVPPDRAGPLDPEKVRTAVVEGGIALVHRRTRVSEPRLLIARRGRDQLRNRWSAHTFQGLSSSGRF